MNALGFSKIEREIHRHSEHHRNLLLNIFQIDDKCMYTMTRSTAEGLQGGIYNNRNHSDYDYLLTNRYIKLYTPRTNNINNPSLLELHENKEYDTIFFCRGR